MTRKAQPIPVPDGMCSVAERLSGRCPEAAKNWFRVENLAPTGAITPVDLVIDGPIVDPFMAEFLGIGVSSTQVVDAILSYRGQPLTVWINSEGGLITAGLAIYNQLLMHDAPVTTVVYGAAMSIASLIAMAGGTVIMAPASFLFIHEARNELDGTAADHRTQADLLDQLSDQIAGAYARRGDSRVNWRALMQAGSGPLQGTLITAEDAVKRRLADRIDTNIVRQPVNLVDLERYTVTQRLETAVNQVDLSAENAMAGSGACCDASTCPDCGECGDCADCQAGDGCECMDCPQMTASNTLTIRVAERAIADALMRDAGVSANEARRRAKTIVAKGWQEADRDDPPPSSGMDEPKPEVDETRTAETPSAAAQVLIDARNWEALYVPMLGLVPITKG